MRREGGETTKWLWTKCTVAVVVLARYECVYYMGYTDNTRTAQCRLLSDRDGLWWLPSYLWLFALSALYVVSLTKLTLCTFSSSRRIYSSNTLFSIPFFTSVIVLFIFYFYSVRCAFGLFGWLHTRIRSISFSTRILEAIKSNLSCRELDVDSMLFVFIRASLLWSSSSSLFFFMCCYFARERRRLHSFCLLMFACLWCVDIVIRCVWRQLGIGDVRRQRRTMTLTGRQCEHATQT